MPPILHPKICSTHADFFKTQLRDRQNNIGRLALKLGYDAVQPVLRKAILNIREVTENVAVLKPYSFVLTGEDNECIAELHLVDDDTMLVSEDLMQGLGEDLDAFWKRLSEE